MKEKGRQKERFEGQRHSVENKSHVLIKEYSKFWGVKGPITIRVFGLGTQCPWDSSPLRETRYSMYTLFTAALFAGSIAAANIAMWVGEDSDGSLS